MFKQVQRWYLFYRDGDLVYSYPEAQFRTDASNLTQKAVEEGCTHREVMWDES